MLRIVVLAALPEECRPLMGLIGSWRLFSRKPFRSFIASFPDRELILIETGMGGGKAVRALQWILSLGRPELICSIGFAGGLSGSIRVGEVFLGSVFWVKEGAAELRDCESLCFEPAVELTRFCDENGIRRARVISVDRAQPKHVLRRTLNKGEMVVDMESSFAAQFAFREQIPFFCFRAVSDGLGDEIDFDLDSITDSNGCVRIPKVLLAVLREPRLVRSFYHSWRRSDKAARLLGRILAKFFMLPEPGLRDLAACSVLYDMHHSRPCCNNEKQD